MISMHLLVSHCLIMLTIEMYLVNLEPSLPLQTGLIVYTKMLGLDFSLGEQQQGRYIIVFIPLFFGFQLFKYLLGLVLWIFDI